MLDEAAILQARYNGPASGPGSMGWYQDYFSSTPQLWKSIGGTGLTGVWQPPASDDGGYIGLSAGDYPQPCTGVFEMHGYVGYGGAATGLQLNGRDVTALQMHAVDLGLDALAAVGPSGLAPPDPTALFVRLAGTYPVDPIFDRTASIWTSAASGGDQLRFQIDSLTVAAVPEPGARAGTTGRRGQARAGPPERVYAGGIWLAWLARYQSATSSRLACQTSSNCRT